MDAFEYISVLTSIVIGLGMAQLLLGVTRIVQHPEKTRPYWIHSCWVAYMFIFTVFWWWWEFNLSKIEIWTFGAYLLVILYGFLVFLQCAMLSPVDVSDYDGLKNYYYARRRWIFGIFMLIQIVDIADAFIKGMDYFYSLGVQYFVSQPIIFAGAMGAFVTRNEKYHAVFAVAAVVFLISQGFIYYETIQ